MPARIHVRIHDLHRIHQRLRHLTRSVNTTERVLLDLALKKLALIRRKFLSGGPAWVPLSPVYLAKNPKAMTATRPRPIRPLLRTGALMRKVRLLRLDDNHLRIGVEKNYHGAVLHNYGTARAPTATSLTSNPLRGWRVPRRSFLFWTTNDRRIAVRRLHKHIQMGLYGNPAG